MDTTIKGRDTRPVIVSQQCWCRFGNLHCRPTRRTSSRHQPCRQAMQYKTRIHIINWRVEAIATSVASLGEGADIPGWHPKEKIFVAESTKNSGQTVCRWCKRGKKVRVTPSSGWHYRTDSWQTVITKKVASILWKKLGWHRQLPPRVTPTLDATALHTSSGFRWPGGTTNNSDRF